MRASVGLSLVQHGPFLLLLMASIGVKYRVKYKEKYRIIQASSTLFLGKFLENDVF